MEDFIQMNVLICLISTVPSIIDYVCDNWLHILMTDNWWSMLASKYIAVTHLLTDMMFYSLCGNYS